MIKKFHLLLLIIVVAVLASCSNNDYLNVIPKDASVVVSIDIAEIAKKGDVANSNLKNFLTESTATLKKSEKEKMQNYQEDPSVIGIDFRAPIYIFKTPTQYVGITMKLYDADNFGEFLEVLRSVGACSKIVEHEGKNFGRLNDCDFAYNDNTFTILVPLGANSKAGNRKVLTDLFKQSEEKSFVGTEAYGKMSDNKGEISVFANMKALPQKYFPLQAFGLKNVRPADIEMYMSATFEDGKAVLTAETQGKTDEAKAFLKDFYKQMHKIEGRYINTLTDNSIFWLCAGVNGSECIKNIKNNPQLKQLFLVADRAIDVEKILNSVDGDISLTIGNIPLVALLGADFNIDYVVTATIKNDDFLKDVNYWKESMKDYGFMMNETSKNQYEILGSGLTINWGVDDDNVYFASNKALFNNAFSQHSNVLEPYTDQIKNSYMFAYLNLEALLDSLKGTITFDSNTNKRVSCLKSVIMYSDEPNKVVYTLELKDKDSNILKQLF